MATLPSLWGPRPRAARVLAGVVALAALTAAATASAAPLAPAFEGPVPRATCGPGSSPEPALQGEVPRADRLDGRSAEGYRCNLELVGRYQGAGAQWVNPSYGDCVYLSTRFLGSPQSPGVGVIDVADPAHPRLAEHLTDPAMLGTWESLKVNSRRGLLAGLSAPPPAGNGIAFFAIYDLKPDCRHPKLLASVPVSVLGHEGDFSPDGNTYWASGLAAGSLTAIDVRDPTHPRALLTTTTGTVNHGFGISDDGNRLYIAEVGNLGKGLTGEGLDDPDIEPNGLNIFDISDVQARRPHPSIRPVGHLYWSDGGAGQNAIPITYGGRPYLVFVDELAEGAARIIDISDEAYPVIVSKLKLEIQMPEHAAERALDLAGTGLFGYEAHYCAVDREADPTTLACGYFQSGIRVFDIRIPTSPREIAYYNPPAAVGKNARLQNSEHAAGPLGTVDATGPLEGRVHGPAQLTADWCSSPPRFVGTTLWVTCQDNGFMVLRFTNGVYPAAGGASPTVKTAASICRISRRLTLRIHPPRGRRIVRVTVRVDGGRTVVRHGRSVRRVRVRRPAHGRHRVTVVTTDERGRRRTVQRTVAACTPAIAAR